MQRRILLAAVIVVAIGACGKSSTSTTTNTTAGTAASAAGFGTAGDAMNADAMNADRTIDVHIMPSLMYSPASISVRPGETVTFKVFNDTTGIHEFVLGDTNTQDTYERTMVGMGTAPMTMPDHSNLVNMQPGVTKSLTWTFPSANGVTVIYGSHEPGDYAHGLKGVITVTGTPVAAGTATTSMGGMTTTTGMGDMGGMTTSTTGMGDMGGMTTTTGMGH